MTKDILVTFLKSGLLVTEAKVLQYLFEHDVAFSRDIERKMDLRQPEVSNAMKVFHKKGWIVKEKEKSRKKGRPLVKYILKKDKEKIINELISACNKKIAVLQKIVNELEEIL